MTLKNLEAMAHVLVVDDDDRICNLVARYLHEHDFIVMTAPDAASAREILKRFAFDILVVDVMMPGETGLVFTKFVREKFNIPVLLLTALGETKDRIVGFESGADDYLAKPFEPKELVLRLQSILRRSNQVKPEDVKAFRMGEWVYVPATEEFRNEAGQVLSISAAELHLIKELAMKAGQPVSRDELCARLGTDPDTRNIDVQVTRLRRKIEQDTKNPKFLQTIRGKGYVLRAEGV